MKIRVSVVYALPDRQLVRAVELESPGSIQAAIEASGLLAECPDIDLGRNRVGIFGRLAHLRTPLREGDQVEIYRPLAADPKESRRRRAAGRPPRG